MELTLRSGHSLEVVKGVHRREESMVFVPPGSTGSPGNGVRVGAPVIELRIHYGAGDETGGLHLEELRRRRR